MTIDILCRVVDNLGDIGFVYRLARALSELPEAPGLRLVVDSLAAFAGICPGVDPSLGYQRVGAWEVVRWDNPGHEAENSYTAVKPERVLECYACGRPDWLERLLFESPAASPRVLIDLEYLTAERWSVDYHLLPSMTRSPSVRKTVFMPGFLPGTGGLAQDAAFLSAIDSCATEAGKIAVRRGLLGLAPYPDTVHFPDILPLPSSCMPSTAQNDRAARDAGDTRSSADTPEHFRSDLPGMFWFVLFSYEHDFTTLIGDLSAFSSRSPLVVFLATGRSADPFLSAWNRAGKPFPVVALPMLPQQTWDRLIAAADFSIVRGEESLSRAVLAGNPFLWECYPFAGADGSLSGHFPKIKAFHALVRDCFSETGNPARYLPWERLSLGFNGIEPQNSGDARTILESVGESRPAFRYFAQKTRDLGNLAVNLMTFMSVSV